MTEWSPSSGKLLTEAESQRIEATYVPFPSHQEWMEKKQIEILVTVDAFTANFIRTWVNIHRKREPPEFVLCAPEGMLEEANEEWRQIVDEYFAEDERTSKIKRTYENAWLATMCEQADADEKWALVTEIPEGWLTREVLEARCAACEAYREALRDSESKEAKAESARLEVEAARVEMEAARARWEALSSA